MTTWKQTFHEQIEEMRNDETKWAALVTDNIGQETMINHVKFICRWASAETSAKLIDAILEWLEANAFDNVRGDAEKMTDWVHKGFSRAFAQKIPPKNTKHMWGDHVYPVDWTVKDIAMKAVVDLDWFQR